MGRRQTRRRSGAATVAVRAVIVAFRALCCLGVVWSLSGLAQDPAPDAYEIGGPLAGLKLGPFPTQHGEDAGYPGCIPALIAQGAIGSDMGNQVREWGPQGMPPELDLYPGSVEHYRAYMFKYMPIRSFFDRQSQLRNFVAAELAGVDRAQVERYAEPVYWVPRHAAPRLTGSHRAAVPVLRMTPAAPGLELDLGELPIGLYAVRVVGAVPTAALRDFRKPLFLRLTVNDAAADRVSTYRRRVGYCDQFYGIVEFYFHVSARRRYTVGLAVDAGSQVDLLVHNISLDDVLAGTVRTRVKQRRTLASDPVVSDGAAVPQDRADRLARDRAIWLGFPPVNAQGSMVGTAYGKSTSYGKIGGVEPGTAELTGTEIVERHGDWVAWGRQTRGMRLPDGTEPSDVFLANPELNLVYTNEDLRLGRPLPDPYPFRDDGAGLYFPDPADPAAGRVWTPIGHRVHQLYKGYCTGIGTSLKKLRAEGGYDHAHDAALTLVRWAYAFPTLDYSRYLSNTVHERGPFGRDYTCRRRETVAFFLPHYPQYVDPIMYQYDELFDFVAGNTLLAESVGRFVPWVRSPDDVLRLIDVYLVQTTAKRILRYHYHTDPMDIANLAAVVGNTAVTEPWLEWLFSRTFIYPLPVAGIQDAMITGTTREGTELVGSTYYAQGEGAARVAESLERYLRTGGVSRFDLLDTERYPKPVSHLYWRFENVVAGRDFLRIGDVCGPDKAPGHTLRNLSFARTGWRWTRDPRFAFVLRHHVGRQAEDDAEWAAVESAAAAVRRAPWLDNRSRVLPMWAGILEAGLAHDEPKRRRAAYLRVGYGMGHHHADTLDLQVFAHGLPMTVDGGQRPGYSTPPDRLTRVHNVVEVDGRRHLEHSWVTALTDHEGARYLAADAVPPAGARAFRRQIALLDTRPDVIAPDEPETSDSYVFDVVRVDGGTQHTYCFHGPLHDAFEWNAENVAAPAEGSPEAEYLGVFKATPEDNAVGDAPGSFVATWRYAREVAGAGMGEREMRGVELDPDAPRPFTRLHLLGVEGSRAHRGQFVCTRWKYGFTQTMVQKRTAAGELSDTFVAVVEPFVGEPFLGSVTRLEVSGDEGDARRPVALGVETRDGERHVCFADGRPGVVRRVPGEGVRVAAEFAFLAADGQGLRQAVIVGGTLLETPSLRIESERRERAGRVVQVDYRKRSFWLDTVWPERSGDRVLEVAAPGSGRRTSYTATRMASTGERTLVTLKRGADYYRSAIRDVREDGRVTCVLRPGVDFVAGGRTGWVASDDEGTRFWRADYLGSNSFQLRPAAAGDALDLAVLRAGGVLRLWEYGVGDTVRQSTSVAVQRLADGLYAVTGDVGLTLGLRGQALDRSGDCETWRPAAVPQRDGWVSATLTDVDVAGTVYLRVRQ